MRALTLVLLVGFAVTAAGPVRSASPLLEIEPGAVVVAPLEGAVSEAQFLFLRRALKSAEASDAAAFVIDMDTPGGSLAAAVKIVDLLLKSPIPTYTYVNSNAGSAGALIALATKHIYMAPVSAIGAAAPVMGGGQDVPETMNAKVVSYYSGYFRSAAEANSYNPELAEAFININKEVKIGDEVISAEGSVLTLSAQEAVKKYDGKPLLASGIAKNLDQLAEEAGLNPERIFIFEPSGFEKLARWITLLAPLFLLGGIIGAYIEFNSPGFGVPGFLSALCFLIFFAGHYVAGLTGFEAVAFFALGLLLVIFELVFFPGVLFVAAIGVVMMLAALLFAMVDYWPSRPFEPSFEVIGPAVMNLSLALVISVFAIALIMRFVPSMPIFRNFLLFASSPTGTSLSPSPRALPFAEVAAGQVGFALTALRPSGRAEFGDALVDVVAEGDFVEIGERVVVDRLEGSTVVVNRAEAARTGS